MSSDFDPFNFMDDSWQLKPYDFTLDMDMDYINAIAVDPSALQHHPVDDFFPFTFNDPSSPSDSSSMQSSSSSSRRRCSSVSSSAASLSPAPESAASPVPVVHQTITDPAALIAERVRQNAGVMLALPITAHLQAFENHSTNTDPTNFNAKLPIPRLLRPVSQPPTNSAASTPPPPTPSSLPSTAPTPATQPQPRSKTSHTTIERRYRTNLNARIQSLRMAVPALRVLDDRDSSGKKRAPNKVLVSGDPLRPSMLGEDIVDERGFVDGVKVARKCSKANVLGKAVEYIRVLKKREARLKNEQAGLKSLISGLVGGPALLKEWEREWKDMFGGEERDEVEGEVDAEAEEDESEDEGEDEEEGARKRKRGKTSSSSSPQVKVEKKEKKVVLSPDGTVPEKRKRGRPRKVVPPPVPPPPPPPPSIEQPQQQYLLATFALFSFFNSPLTSFSSWNAPSAAVHVHTGTVLNGSTINNLAADSTTSRGWGPSYWLQLFHLVVSVVVLVKCVSSWAGIKIKLGPVVFGKTTHATSFLTKLQRHSRNDGEKLTPADWVRLAESYVFSSRSHSISILSRLQAYYHISTWDGAGPSEMCTAALVLYGCGARTRVPLVGGLARAKARLVWNRYAASAAASASASASALQELVFEAMDVDQAAAMISDRDDANADASGNGNQSDEERKTPMRVLAAFVVRERVRAHLGAVFVGCVRRDVGVGGAHADGDGDGDGDVCEEMERREMVRRGRTVEAAKELGGCVGEIGRRFERVWKVVSGGEEDEEEAAREAEDGDGDDEIGALVDAVVLYRRVVDAGVGVGVGVGGNGKNKKVTALISPPPSPGRKDRRKKNEDLGRLRRALGCRVFEESAVLEDARDRAVDRVVELERSNVGLV